MTIKIHHRRQVIECETVAEFRAVIQALNEEDERIGQRGNTSLRQLADLLGGGRYWDGERFLKFVDALGEAQTKLVGLLVRRGSLTDEALRAALGLENNQQLAGVLSGISKRAAALNIPAREVFTINKEFQSGDITKSYLIAADFLRIATEMNWPAE